MRPHRPSRRALSGVAILLATLALAMGESAGARKLELAALPTSPVALTAPLPEAALVGGATAEIAWRPLADFAALAGATEWEAFLSVDGGRTYPVRLTPHLDLARRSFVFRVPDLPSDDVRLLLRIGDEQVERAVPFATRWRIVRSPSPAPAAIAAAFAGPALSPGEPALAGAAGVLFWVEGDRDGSHLRQRSAVPLGARSAADPALLAGGPDSLASEDSDGLHLALRIAPATHPAARPRHAAAVARAEPLTVSDILLLIQRQNE